MLEVVADSHVGGDEHGTIRSQCCSKVITHLLASATEDDRCTLGMKPFHCGPADAGRAAGDDGHPAFETRFVHVAGTPRAVPTGCWVRAGPEFIEVIMLRSLTYGS